MKQGIALNIFKLQLDTDNCSVSACLRFTYKPLL